MNAVVLERMVVSLKLCEARHIMKSADGTAFGDELVTCQDETTNTIHARLCEIVRAKDPWSGVN